MSVAQSDDAGLLSALAAFATACGTLERGESAQAQGSLNGAFVPPRVLALEPLLLRVMARALAHQGAARHRLWFISGLLSRSYALLGEAPETLGCRHLLGSEADQGAQAKRLYRLALELDPDCSRAHFNLGCLLAGEDAPEEALAHLDAAARAEPWYARFADLRAAQALDRAGRHAEAGDRLRRAMGEGHEAFGELRPVLGGIMRRAGDAAAALNHYGRALGWTHVYPPEFCTPDAPEDDDPLFAAARAAFAAVTAPPGGPAQPSDHPNEGTHPCST